MRERPPSLSDEVIARIDGLPLVAELTRLYGNPSHMPPPELGRGLGGPDFHWNWTWYAPVEGETRHLRLAIAWTRKSRQPWQIRMQAEARVALNMSHEPAAPTMRRLAVMTGLLPDPAVTPLIPVAEAVLAELRGASAPSKLRTLAQWMDNRDDRESYPGPREVQEDMRRWADLIEKEEG